MDSWTLFGFLFLQSLLDSCIMKSMYPAVEDGIDA